jgi:peptide deformylase
MATREIVLYPDPVLSTKGDDVPEVDDGVRQLLDDLVETLYAASGVGLAAQQIGDTRRVCVIDIRSDDGEAPGKLIELVNPHIVERFGEIKWEEGCLSFPELYETIDRSARVKVEALDRQGNPFEVEGEGLLAVVLQHEIDHLDGVLFIDRMGRLKRRMALKRYRKTLEARAAAPEPAAAERA